MLTSRTRGNRIASTQLSPMGAHGFAARNLELLAAIENTLDALNGDTQLIDAITNGYLEIRDRLAGQDNAIDPEGRIERLLTKASDACARIYRDARQRHASAQQDTLLTAEDGIEAAYSAFMAAINRMHDVVEDLREWIALHDAVLQPTTGTTFCTTDDLFESLLSSR